MQKFIYDNWNVVMNAKINPLSNIKDISTRHLVMQILAWMWCITFSAYFGSMWVFGYTAIAHTIIIAAIVMTVATFQRAISNPTFSYNNGYHTSSRSRQIMYLSGNGRLERIELDPNDPGGEHE